MKRGWLLLAIAPAYITVCGLAFSATQHAGIIPGIYWAVVTASTTGYGDVTAKGTSGQLLSIGVMLTAIPLLASAFALITSAHVGGRIRAHVDERLAEHHQAIHDRLDRLEGQREDGTQVTTGTLTFYDAAWPPARPPASDGVCIYLAGDTPHVWTVAEIAAQPARYRLPVFVRSNPPGPGAAADVATAVARLHAIGAPTGTLVAWDMEMADDAAYILAVFEGLWAADYELIVYGSQSTVLGNDNPDGLYWGADWTDVPHLHSPDAMTQWVSFAAYDLSLGRASLPFWDTRPGPAPAPQPQPPTLEEIVALAPTVKFGDTGQPVKNVQALLNARGASLGIDGQFGALTKGALITVQRRLGLTPDVVCGPLTLNALLTAP